MSAETEVRSRVVAAARLTLEWAGLTLERSKLDEELFCPDELEDYAGKIVDMAVQLKLNIRELRTIRAIRRGERP